MQSESLYAFQIGQIMGKLMLVQKDLHMGEAKDALANVNDLIKYIESEIAIKFYKKPDEVKDEREESDKGIANSEAENEGVSG